MTCQARAAGRARIARAGWGLCQLELEGGGIKEGRWIRQRQVGQKWIRGRQVGQKWIRGSKRQSGNVFESVKGCTRQIRI